MADRKKTKKFFYRLTDDRWAQLKRMSLNWTIARNKTTTQTEILDLALDHLEKTHPVPKKEK